MTAADIIASAQVAALTHAHDRHAERMRSMHDKDSPVYGLIATARMLACNFAPTHDTGVYALADTERLYARRLLLQAAAAMFDGTAEGDLLRAVDAWLTLGGRQHSYTEADSAAMLDIMCDLTEAAEDIADEILKMSNEIGGE